MKPDMHLFLSAACWSLAIFSLGCMQQKPATETRAFDEAAIRQTDAACSKAAETKQLDAWAGCYTDDASVFPPNTSIITGKEANRRHLEHLFEVPGLHLAWQTTKVEVARSGDLAYSSENYEETANDPNGNPVTDRGKGVAVWKKQTDGSWKMVADIFNSDLPLAPPPKK